MADSGGSQRGGGSSSRRNRSGSAATAVLLALVGVIIVAGRNAETAGNGLSAAKAAASKGHYDAAWRALSLTGGKAAATDRTTQCAANSFGQVRDAFLRTPCQSLRRTLLAVRDVPGNTVFVSIAWVTMATAAGARALQVVADRDGSGDIRPIGGAVLSEQQVRFTGDYYASRRSGPLLVIAEAAPVRGRPSTTVLHHAAEVGAQFPVP